MPGQHVALGGGVAARHEPDQSREARQGALARLVEQPFAGELLLQPLERGQVGAEADALDRQRAQAKLAALLVELRAAEDLHALAVGEVELQRVEQAALHLHADARAALGILEREEHRLPALLPPQLGDLAVDPDRRQAAEPRADALVERADGVDLAPVDLRRFDLHRGDANGQVAPV